MLAGSIIFFICAVIIALYLRHLAIVDFLTNLRNTCAEADKKRSRVQKKKYNYKSSFYYNVYVAISEEKLFFNKNFKDISKFIPEKTYKNFIQYSQQ
jgi:hypothetical protein